MTNAVRRALYVFACAGALAASAAAAQVPKEPTDAQSLALGRALVQRHCGMCHAIGRVGDSPNPQAPPFRYLSQRMDVESLGEGLAQGILTQHPAMPEFRFAPNEVVGIVRYLKSVQAKQQAHVALPGALVANGADHAARARLGGSD